jgi:streptogrisin B
MTVDMPASVPGDSGGPVWVNDDDGQAHIIGIWLGEKASADSGRRYGRFAGLRAALTILT